jgi:hypothetical protein
MINIDNTHDANKYYKLVNDFIDKYITDWKIKPSKLAIYLKNNSKFEKFLDKNKLKEVWNINRIINDVIEDRVGLEYDGVLKFEKFSLLKENLISLGTSDISYEKILADYTNIGLSHIFLRDFSLNLYLIKDFDKKRYVSIYSDNDLIKNLENIKFTIQKKIILDYHEIDDLEGYNFNLDLRIGDITDNNKLLTKLNEIINKDFFLSILKQAIYKKYKKYSKYQKIGVYHILELINEN